MARLVDGPIDAAAILAEARAASCGAVVLFLGTVRDRHAGRAVSAIFYGAYRRMAQPALERIERELEAETPGLRLRIVHRLGAMAVGEASVAIAAAAPHRPEAYAASRSALERLKKEIPIWKRERYADGEEAWREEEPLARVD